jgi:esterase
MKLNFRTLGEGKPIVILHGFFGSADNWQTIGKELSDTFKVYLVDQRNHGLSPHDDAFDYDVMTADLLELFEDENLSSAIVMGHSMGGKTAMNFAANYPEKVEKLIVVDIGPKQYPPHHENIFNGFNSVNLAQVVTRKDADDQLSSSIPDFGVRQFILKNLTRGDNGFEWRINLKALETNAYEVGRALDDGDVYLGPTLFIGGAKSNYIKPEDTDLIHNHFPNSRIEMIEGSGHWVHAEKPQELLTLVKKFIL